MTRRALPWGLLGLLLSAAALWWIGFHGQRPDLILFPPPSEDAPWKRLREPVSVEFHDEPVAAALKRLSRRAGVPVQADPAELATLGPSVPATVSGRYVHWPLEGVVEDLTRQLHPRLRVGVEPDRVRITTEQAWRSGLNHYTTRLHRLDSPLAGLGGPMDELQWISQLASAVDPAGWTTAGGLGQMQAVPGGILAVQTVRHHHQLRALLEVSSHGVAGPEAPSRWIDPPRTPADEAVLRALARPVKVSLDGVPLTEVLTGWSRTLDVPIHLDRAALERGGYPLDTPISADLHPIPFQEALDRLLVEPLGLAWQVRHGRLWITSDAAAQQWLSLRAYDVSDISLAADRNALLRCLSDLGRHYVWSPDGHVALLDLATPVLVARQSDAAHGQIERFLAELRKVERPFAKRRTSRNGREEKRHETLAFTSAEQEASRLETRCYRMARLLAAPEWSGPPKPSDHSEALLALLAAVIVSPNSPANTGPAPLRLEGEVLTATCPRATQRALAALLPILEQAMTGQTEEQSWTVGQVPRDENRPFLRVHRLDWLSPRQRPDLPWVIHSRDTGRWNVVGGTFPPGGGIGACGVYRDCLVVLQTAEGHSEVDRLLDTLRGIASSDDSPAMLSGLNPAPRERLWQALQKPVDLVADERPLSDVLDDLARQANIPIRLESAATAPGSEGAGERVTLFAAGVPLGIVLESICRDPPRRFDAVKQQLLIAPRDGAISRAVVQGYNLADLDAATRRPEPSETRLPLPWYLQPHASPFGRVAFASTGANLKHAARGDDPLRDILLHTHPVPLAGAPLAPRIGPVLFDVRALDSQWILSQTIGTLRRQLRSGRERLRRGERRPASIEPAGGRPVTLDDTPRPRHAALRQLAEQADLSLLVESSALAPGTAALGQTVSPPPSDLPSRDALRHLLEGSEMDFIERGETLVALGRSHADGERIWRVHDVAELAGQLGPRGELTLCLIISHLDPFSWRHDDNDWPYDDQAILACLPDSLVIRHQRRLQRRVAELLDVLRALAEGGNVTWTLTEETGVRVELRGASPAERDALLAEWIRASRAAESSAQRDAAAILLCRLRDPPSAVLQWLAAELRGQAEGQSASEERLFQLCQGAKNYGNRVPEAVEPLGRMLLATSDQPLRNQLIGALAACGEAARDPLLSVVNRANAADLGGLLEFLRAAPATHVELVPVLLEMLAETASSPLIEALTTIDSSGRESHRVLEQWTRSSEVLVRHRAAQLEPLIRGIFGAPKPADSSHRDSH